MMGDFIDDMMAIDAARTAEAWMAYARKLEAKVRDLQHQLQSANGQLMAENAQLRAENEHLRLNGALDAAQIAAMQAQRTMLVDEIKGCTSPHPCIYEGPDGKKPAGKIYDETFDREAERRGIRNPAQYRT